MKRILISLVLMAATFAMAAKAKPTLVFFMNPNGAPCQMQDKMLLERKKEIDSLATLRYVKTTVPEDRQAFYQYGVRSLPNLLLVDSTGKELARFAPGIQNVDEVLKTLRAKK